MDWGGFERTRLPQGIRLTGEGVGCRVGGWIAGKWADSKDGVYADVGLDRQEGGC